MTNEEQQSVVHCNKVGLDFKLSCFVAATAHYRRATVCSPFPIALFERESVRDYDGLLQCLSSLPSAAQLDDAQVVARLSSLQLQLLHWLANHPRRPASSIHPATMDDVRQRLPGLRGWVSDIAFNPSLRPAAVLRLAPIPPPEVLAGQALAWHGTSFENLHSVLHTGLLNLSGTRLERTGAAFGKGIYFSSEITVAYAFCPASAATAWGRGALGRRLRCLLVCGVDRDHALQGTGEVPDRYLLVERTDVVKVFYAFVYVDDRASGVAAADAAAGAGPAGAAAGPGQMLQQPQRRRRLSPLAALAVAYVAWVVWQGLQNWPWLRRAVRRYLGIRL